MCQRVTHRKGGTMKTKTTQGFLYKRGATYFARWQHEGKSYRQTTGETDRRKAEAKLKEFVEPYSEQHLC